MILNEKHFSRKPIIVILIILLVYSSECFFLLFQSARASIPELGVQQRVLNIGKYGGAVNGTYYNLPRDMGATMNLPVDVAYMDQMGRFPNSTLYDEYGNGKYCLIFMNYYGFSYLNSTELSYLDSYEQTFNVTEADTIAAVNSTTWNARTGIATFRNAVMCGNYTFTANNVRFEASQKGSGNYTSVVNCTLAAGATVYAFAGNNTQALPLLWSFKNSNGVVHTACAMQDASPDYLKDGYTLPFMLAMKLSPVNVLWSFTFSFDIDDINGYGYGRAWNATEVQSIINFSRNYSLPLTLLVMDINPTDWNATGWGEAYRIIVQHPEIFGIIAHPALQVQSLDIPTYWNTLNSYGLNPNYWYCVPGGHWINSSIAQYIYANYSIFAVRQSANTGSGQVNTAWLPVYPPIWAPFGSGSLTSPNRNGDNITGYDWGTDPNYYDYASFLHGAYTMPSSNMMQYCGISSIVWDHYPEWRNEQPVMTALEDGMFNIGIYKLVPTRSEYAALMSRTFMGGYNITNPIYYPASRTLNFSLTSKGNAPDDLCGIVLPTTKAKMDDQIFYASGNIGSKCDSGAFLEFKYVQGKTYTVYLGQEEAAKPTITIKNSNSQLWLTNSNYYNGQLNITFQSPKVSGLKSIIQVSTGNLGEPANITGATGVFDNASGIETLAVTNAPNSENSTTDWTKNVIVVWNNIPSVPEFPSTDASLVAMFLLFLLMSASVPRKKRFKIA